MRLLVVADTESDEIFLNLPKNIDLIVSSGDVDLDYLKKLKEILGVSLVYVYGNHDRKVYNRDRYYLDKNLFYLDRYVFVGFSGSHLYNNEGGFQYSQFDMLIKVLKRVPRLIIEKFIKKKDIICVTHSPIKNIHDKKDITHRGFFAFYLLLILFSPKLFIHGHIHLKDRYQIRETGYNKTKILNIYGYKIVEINDEKIEIYNR